MASAKLVLNEPFQPAQNILIDSNPFLIGRGAECNHVLDRSGVSKQHFRIAYDGEEYLLQDLHSKNGTRLNGELLSESHVLRERDLISIAGVDLTFRILTADQMGADFNKRLRQLRTALEFGKSLSGRKHPDPILDDIMEALMRLSQAERGFLLLDNDGTLEMVRAVNFSSEEFQAEKFRLSRTALDQAMQNRRAVVVSNAGDDTFYRQHTSIQELNLKTLVCVPVAAEDRILGLLYADSDCQEQEFTTLDVEVLESLAANAGFALENARLNQSLQNLVADASEILRDLEQESAPRPETRRSLRVKLDSIALKKKSGA